MICKWSEGLINLNTIVYFVTAISLCNCNLLPNFLTVIEVLWVVIEKVQLDPAVFETGLQKTARFNYTISMIKKTSKKLLKPGKFEINYN